MALLIHDVPIDCINQAAITYHVPAKLIISILKTEGGRKGSATRNKNGSYDYGPMQINSSWLKQLRPYGYTADALQNNPCLNVRVGTWILAKAVSSEKELWRGIGNYHSCTFSLNIKYQQKIARQYSFINKQLAKR